MMSTNHPNQPSRVAFFGAPAIFLGGLLVATSCFSQTTNTTGSATTTGKCSPAVSGNSNRVMINCEGVTKEQGDALLKILNTVLTKQLDPTVVMSRLNEIQSGVSDIKGKLDRRNAEEQEAERIRRTAPLVDVYLKPAEKGKVYLIIKSINLIPFQFHYFIVQSNNNVLGGFPISDSTVYPKPGYDLFNVEKDIDLNQIADHYIELRFFFKSLSVDELHLPGHDGEIIRKYKIQPDDTLSPIE